MFKRQGAAGLALALSLTMALVVACGGSSTPAATGATNGANNATLVVANEDSVNTLDPAGGLGTHTGRTLGNVYESLVRQNGESGKIEPSLATSWKVGDGGLQYTFQLRKGVKFQDGTPFNAKAVVFTFDRALDAHDPYYYGPYAFPSFFQPDIKSVQAIGQYTVKFALTKVDPTFIPNLLWSTFGIVSPTAVKKYGKQFPYHGAGTGPYKIVKWDKGAKLVMKAFKGYWGGAPKIQTLIFKPVTENAARLTQLKNGEVNVVPAITPQLLPSIKSDPNLKVVESPGIHSWFVMLNTQQGPLKNVLVRRAINYAINRKALVTDLLHGTAVGSTSFSYPGTWAYNPASGNMYPYNLTKAKGLLKQAGYGSGFSLSFLVPNSGSGMIAPKQIANVIQSDLAKIGVKVRITTEDWNTYLATLNKGLDQPGHSYDMAEMSWMSTGVDPGLYVNYYLGCNSTPSHPNTFNDGYYCDQKVATLLKQAMTTTDQSTRANLYKQAEVLVGKDAPWLFMFHSKHVIVMDKNVQGVVPNPNMNYLWLGSASLDH